MAMFCIKLTILSDFSQEEVQISLNDLNSFYVTDSPLSVANIAMFYIKLTSLSDFPDSPLSVTNIAQMAMFYLNLPVLMIFP